MSQSATIECQAPVLVPLDQIRAGNNDREVFKESEIRDLAVLIERQGLLSPVVLRRRPGHLELVAGERRYRAHQVLGRSEIPAFIKDLTDEEASEIMLSENLGRKQLTPIEEAKACRKRMSEGWTTDKIATAAGMSEDLVKRRLTLLTLLPIVIQLLGAGEFPVGHAELMVPLDAQRQQMAFNIYSKSRNGLNRDAFRDIVLKLQSEQDTNALFDLESFFSAAVSEPLVIRGKLANTGVRVRTDTPPVQVRPRDTQALIIKRYHDDLEQNGLHSEAAIIGNIYDALVRSNHLRVAPTSAV